MAETRGRKKKAETKSYKMQFLIEESIKDELESQANEIGLELKDYVRWILTQRARNIEVRTHIIKDLDNKPQTNNSIGFEAKKEENQSTTNNEVATNVVKNSMFGAK